MKNPFSIVKHVLYSWLFVEEEIPQEEPTQHYAEPGNAGVWPGD